MAQGTGDKRLLTPIAKTTGAGLCLALAVGALAGGCGGDSSDPAAQDTASQGASPAQSPSASGAPQPPAAPKGHSQAQGAPAPGAQSAASGQGQKQGPGVAVPEGPPERAPTPEQIAKATVADITLQSPAIVAAGGRPGRLAPTYTCDGQGSWPELRWSGVPAGTAELALFVMNVQPVQEKLFVDWALAGLDPGLEGIEAGRLPKGAIPGTNGFGKRGYRLCPTGGGEIYMFALYALPKRLAPAKGFDARALRKEVLALSGNVGLLPAVYER